MAIRVLLCSDGSDASKKTCAFAARLSRAIPLEVVLGHVLEFNRLQYKMIPDFQVDMIHQRAKEMAEAVLEREAGYLRDHGVEARPRLLVGPAGPTICEAARNESAALVILGRRGQSDLQDLLFGSVSSHVVSHCDRPVLVVKRTGRFPEPDSWSVPLRCLVGVDGSEASLRCIDHLAAISEASEGMHITLLYVVNPQRAGLEHLSNEARYEALAKMHREGAAQLEASAERLRKLGFQVDVRVEEGTAGRTICRIAEEDGYDLSMMGRRGIGEVADVAFGSVSHFVMHHCAAHVLIVP